MKSIAIVGLGPRGVSLLERLITHIIIIKIKNIEIYLFEKNEDFGSGCHSISLPKDILTNTIAGQMTMFFGDAMKQFGPIYDGPSLCEWHRTNYSKKTKVTDYLPRSDLGHYLKYFYFKQISRMQQNNIVFHQISSEVIDIISHVDSVDIQTKNRKYNTSQCILCIGHQKSENNNIEYLDEFTNYSALDEIGVDKTVAVQGMGLTAFDVISRLTEGREGRYEKINSLQLKYITSGYEPKIYLFSRSGVFLAGRAFNPNHNFIYTPKFFTKENIKKIKSNKSEIDFDKDILPLLSKELSYAYNIKGNNNNLNLDLFYNPEKHLDNSTQQQFKKSFLRYLKWDIEQCVLGKMESPYKFCQDAIRDLRDEFRELIDFDNFSSKSYRHFISYWQPKFLKICVGPPYIRLMQLDALIQAGVCSVDFALNPIVIKKNDRYTLKCTYGESTHKTSVDLIIKARTPSINLQDTPNPLTKNLLRRFKGFSVAGELYGGLEINKNNQVLYSNSKVSSNVYAIGIPTEGSKYFTLVLARPNMVSTFLLDSNNLAKKLLKDIGLHTPQTLPT